jgi:hypothetical protein
MFLGLKKSLILSAVISGVTLLQASEVLSENETNFLSTCIQVTASPTSSFSGSIVEQSRGGSGYIQLNAPFVDRLSSGVNYSGKNIKVEFDRAKIFKDVNGNPVSAVEKGKPVVYASFCTGIMIENGVTKNLDRIIFLAALNGSSQDVKVSVSNIS